MAEQIGISNAALELFRRLSKSAGHGKLALHLTWRNDVSEWVVGLTPENDIFAKSPEMQTQIVAGRCRDILVLVDGPSGNIASKLQIRIDATSKLDRFKVDIRNST